MPQVTQAKFPLPIPGEPELYMSPLTDRDGDELSNWLRSTYIAMARLAITPDMTPAERQEVLGVAMDRARRLHWNEGYGATLMSDARSVARVIWQGCRRNHPDLTFDAFMQRIMDNAGEVDQARLDAALKVWEELNIIPASRGAASKKAEHPRARVPPEKKSTRR